MKDPRQYLADQLALLRQTHPLVVNITNYVVMNNTANALLALGASPIMAHSHEEMEEMLTIAGALVINIGTLDRQWIARMKHAAQLAVQMNKPLVLDPVGCGASELRTHTSRELCEIAKALGPKFIVRGNASEIMALSGEIRSTKGVDSLETSDNALGAAMALYRQYGCEVVVSGETDYVVGRRIFTLHDGHDIMPRVTGMGCTFTALTAAFAAQPQQEYLSPGLASAAVMGVAGKLAAAQSQGPGSFQMQMLDALYQLTPEQLAASVTVSELS
ncbi:hydroxyethylthiazole kinase [Shewanella corallii]|uniref:Hydroxyethylthiazole kinase n=1 Tax=Shewanella corallii TaxID=560080 RepID=A0ABT0N2V4_9GAMM|nr:hydroxyethylthiazole kinase [Shewanella corallii]MCL2912769.1 hydroxyethylthiazole kinase [Shewanella corallii]